MQESRCWSSIGCRPKFDRLFAGFNEATHSRSRVPPLLGSGD